MGLTTHPSILISSGVEAGRFTVSFSECSFVIGCGDVLLTSALWNCATHTLKIKTLQHEHPVHEVALNHIQFHKKYLILSNCINLFDSIQGAVSTRILPNGGAIAFYERGSPFFKIYTVINCAVEILNIVHYLEHNEFSVSLRVILYKPIYYLVLYESNLQYTCEFQCCRSSMPMGVFCFWKEDCEK